MSGASRPLGVLIRWDLFLFDTQFPSVILSSCPKQDSYRCTFHNESTGATHPVEGRVGEKTQRAAWKAVGGTNVNIIMELGVFNLTQDRAPVPVHFGPEQTQTALLVRLDESQRPESGE